jgi:hypothetical protein
VSALAKKVTLGTRQRLRTPPFGLSALRGGRSQWRTRTSLNERRAGFDFGERKGGER